MDAYVWHEGFKARLFATVLSGQQEVKKEEKCRCAGGLLPQTDVRSYRLALAFNNAREMGGPWVKLCT